MRGACSADKTKTKWQCYNLKEQNDRGHTDFDNILMDYQDSLVSFMSESDCKINWEIDVYIWLLAGGFFNLYLFI